MATIQVRQASIDEQVEVLMSGAEYGDPKHAKPCAVNCANA